MSKATVEIICRALLAIVAALRKEYGLPEYHNIVIHVDGDIAGAIRYNTDKDTRDV
jgi:hypothetical protein